MRKPARCQRTTVSGLTIMRDCFQADQNRRAATQKSLSNGSGLQRGQFVNEHSDGDRHWGVFEGKVTTAGSETTLEGT